MTATEANRYVIRNARTLTGRPKILVMQECYHGSLDETLPHIGDDGKLCLRSHFDSNPIWKQWKESWLTKTTRPSCSNQL